MQDYQERIQMDRYAIKNPDAQPKVGDTVVVALKRRFSQDGEMVDSREIGIVTRVWISSGGSETEYSVTLRDRTKPQATWEVVEHIARTQLDVLVETSYADICRRVADGIIKLEPGNHEFRDAVYQAMVSELFVPAGRILAGVGRDDLRLTLFNCYVFPAPHDSITGIFGHAELIANTYKTGGGIGWHCSSLRPKGTIVRKSNGKSSGVVSWVNLYSFVTGLVEQGGSRMGAGLQGLWVWHPDIVEFIEAKSQRTTFTLEDGREVSRNSDLVKNSNVSVLISDKFMEAVKSDAMWDLVFPDLDDPEYDQVWTGDLEEWTAGGHKAILYKRVKAKWLWDLIIRKAWESGEPGILFMDRANKMSNSWYYNKLTCTNPCGEVPLPNFGCCNLGHLHLAKFIRQDVEQFPEEEIDSETAIKRVDWDLFKQTIFMAIRFLDNTTDINLYHMAEIERQQTSERRIGLGILGYAELLVRLGLRYGSPEAEKFTHYMFRRFSKYSYLASVALAKERGAFPAFDRDKFLASGFMKIHDEEVIAAVRENGIRNVTLNTAAPTGCVTADTLISVNGGFTSIENLGNIAGSRWQDINELVETDEGARTATKFFINGTVPVRQIITERGFSVTASLRHRLRVVDQEGNYVWKYVEELQPGDTMVLKRGTLLPSLGDGKRLKSGVAAVILPPRLGASSVGTTKMTVELAELLGFYMGNGYTKDKGGLHIVISDKDLDVQEHVAKLMLRIWGGIDRNITSEKRVGCTIISMNDRKMAAFFHENGFAKPKGNHGEGAAGAFIPAAVLTSGGDYILAFLRGLFETDGSVNKSSITLSTVSPILARQVQRVLLGLNIVTDLTTAHKTNSFGKRILYIIRVINTREAYHFVSDVGFIGVRKRARCKKLGALCDRGDTILNDALVNEFYAASAGMPNRFRQAICQRRTSGRGRQVSLTQQFISVTGNVSTALQNTRAYRLIQMGVFLDPIAKITSSTKPTYDLSVPIGNTYIANGFVSHNSVGTMLNTTTGIEPYFLAEWTARSRIGVADEEAGVLAELRRKFGRQPPSYFVTTDIVTPEEHVRTQAAVQRWIDASIAKCIAAGTLIPTDKGLVSIEAFADAHEADTFVPTNGKFKTGGYRILSHYRAGQKAATRIRLDDGAELVGATESHRILTPKGWQRMADLKPGDIVVGRFQESHGKGGMSLEWTDNLRSNANSVKTPKRMTPAFARFLGMLAADGHTIESTGCTGITCKNDYVAAEFRRLCQEIFHVAPKEAVDARNGVLCIYLTSRNLVRFTESLIGRGAYNKHAPMAVLRGSYEEKLAFLEGVTLDGCATPQGLSIYEGMSKELAYHVAEIARSFGRPRVNQGHKWVAPSSAYAYSVIVSNEMQEIVTPIEPHKRKPTTYKRFKVLADVHKVDRSTFYSRSSEYYALRAAQYRNQTHLFNTTAKSLGIPADTPVHRVTNVEDAGVVEMYDVEVEDAHEYVVNGMVSHNTVNMPNSATVEDASKVYTMLYDLGCKGGTIYRDRSRDRQVLYHKGTEPKIPVEIVDEYMKGSDDAAQELDVIRPRIKAGLSVTLSQKTPTGWVHGTIRMHPQTGEPYDLFLSSGKGDIAADVQAIGRLISVILRWPNHNYIGQATRLEIVRKQLFRIPGGQQEGFGPNATISMPDGIAHLLHQYLSGSFPLALLPLGVKPMEQYIEEVGPELSAQEALRQLLIQPSPREQKLTAEDDAPDFADQLLPELTSGLPLEQCPECKQVGLLRQIGHCPHCVVCGLKLC